MIFESRRRGGSAATTAGQYRVASGIRNKADSLGDVRKKKNIYIQGGGTNPVATSERARIISIQQSGKAMQASPRHRLFLGLTELKHRPDRDSAHLGASAHKPAAMRLRCGGDLRDSAGRC